MLDYSHNDVTDVFSAAECATATTQLSINSAYVDPTMAGMDPGTTTWSSGYRCAFNRTNVVQWRSIASDTSWLLKLYVCASYAATALPAAPPPPTVG